MKFLLLLVTIFTLTNIQAQEVQFTSYNVGQPFKAITVDKYHKTVWAGRSIAGVYNLDISSTTTPSNFMHYDGRDLSSNINLTGLKIKSMASDDNGNVWVGHEGSTDPIVGHLIGGVERISRVDSNDTNHYYPDINEVWHPFNEGDGLVSHRVSSIAVDKNNTVWIAQRDHHFFLDYIPDYFFTAGDFSYKKYNELDFATKAAWWDPTTHIPATQPLELPYPKNTTDFFGNPEARPMRAISVDDNEVWIAVDSYYPINEPDTLIPDRVIRYDLDGNYIPSGTVYTGTYSDSAFNTGGFSYSDMQMPEDGRINGICANDEKGTWVTTDQTGKGFSVYKDNVWYYMSSVNFPLVIPSNAKFNDNAIWKDKIGRVFIGTDSGLIVYDGEGAVNEQEAYTIYTNYEFGEENPRNVFTETMLSSNITGGCYDPTNPDRSWVTTNSGIMEMLLKIEGMVVYHVKDHYTYYNTTVDTNNNILFMTNLLNQVDVSSSDPEFALDSDFPIVAADGTGSTIFRYKTSDPQGFYDNLGINGISSKYHVYVGYGGDVGMINSEEYIEEYGQFILKDLSSYEGSPTNAEDLEFVELIYIHPTYIDENSYATGKNHAYEYFNIKKVVEPNELVFKHLIKISVAPIILAHGVWSDIGSMEKLKNYLIKSTNNGGAGYDDFAIKRVWRTDSSLAENSYFGYGGAGDYKIIPSKIKELKHTAANNLFSAGKVNVIAHSRGGLYTRGYVESLMYDYIHDVNSLITLNTPHFGAQGANLVLDERVVINNETVINTFINDVISDNTLINVPVSPNGLTIGNIASVASVPENDRINNWGAKNLLVELDALTGVYQPNTYATDSFIHIVNSPAFVGNLNRIPIHTISTEFDPCLIYRWLCNDLSHTDGALTSVLPKPLRFGVYVYNAFVFVSNDIPNGINALTSQIYDGETNDFVVPLSSMKGGLGGTNFNTHLSSNIMHSTIGPILGVTEHAETFVTVKSLLRANKIDENTFTKHGLASPKLRYNFLPDFEGNRLNTTTITSKILINRDPVIFDNVSEDEVLNFSVYVHDVDKIMIEYENENLSEMFSYEIRENLSFENTFTYQIPTGYSGKTTIKATGFKNGTLGVSTSIITFNTNIPSDVILQSIYFEQQTPIILNQSEYTFNLKGTFSDGIDRLINNLNGVSYDVEDEEICSVVNNNTLKGDSVGNTLFTATINGFEDTVLVTVEENLSLMQTILTSFYGNLNDENTAINLNWETLKEYESDLFVLERSFNTSNNFIEINQQAGNGTLNEPAQFNFTDTLFEDNTIVYYRLKMINDSGDITYSSTIEINLLVLGIEDNNFNNLTLELYPNPTKTDQVTLKLNTDFIDKNAKLELYSLQGKRLARQTLNIIEGNNSFNLKIGQDLINGIYLVRISTIRYVKTVKLIIDK